MSFTEVADAETAETGAAAAVPEERLSIEEVRQRAVGGAAIDVFRGLGSRFLGFFGTLVLAHLVTPSELGTVALGMTFMSFGNFVADGGVGATLIRQVKPVERTELKALLGFQLTVSTAIAFAVSAALFPFGEIGQATALMVMSLPLTAIRAPAVILLERQLRYRPFAIVEFAEAICYYGLAIGLVTARKHVEFSIRPGLIRPTVVAVGAAAAGWVVASEVGISIVGGLMGALFAAGAYLAALWLWHRSSLLDSFHLSRRGLQHALRSA